MLATSLTDLEPVHEGSSLIIVRGTVNGLVCGDVLIDSGAASCFVSEQWAKEHRLLVRSLRQPLKVSLGDGVTEGTLIGMVSAAEVTTQESTASCSLLVMKQLSHQVILGMPWLEAAAVTINFQLKQWNGKRLMDLSIPQQGPGTGSSGRAVLSAVKVGSEHGERLETILRCYPTAFRTDLLRRSTVSLERAIKCKITLKDPQCRPTVDGERRRSPADRGILIEVVKEMEAAGLIRPSKSPWSSQPVLVKKVRDGVEIAEKRPCWDYRRVNDRIVGDAHPLPLPENMFAELTGSQVFSKMDLLKGFWQIPLEEDSKAILAMATPLGLYEPNHMPFGMKNAPAVFQREMQRVLRDRLGQGVMVFIDDILIHSKTVEEHEALVRWVLSRLVEEGYYAHPDKCEFFQREVSFLGHVISGKGVAVQAHKVKAVQEWPVLTKKREVRQFLGLVNYYRKFIPNFSEIARPLTDLTHDHQPWLWGEKEQTAFDTLKQRLSTADVLAHPDSTRQWIIHTDASEFAIAGVLSQQQADETVRPVAYFSRKMSGAETKYDSIHEKELLALVKAVEHWRCYLEGSASPVLLYTDHKGLSWLNSQKELTGRQTRWVERLAELEYKVIHIAGIDNGAADALSRRTDYEGVPLVEVAKEGREGARAVSSEPSPPAGTVGQRTEVAEDIPVRTRIVLHSTEANARSESDSKEERKERTETSGTLPPLMDEIREAVSRDEWYRSKMAEQHPSDGLVREAGLLRSVSGQWYIPDDSDLKTRLLYEVHDSPGGGHLGVKKTLHKLQRVCWWLGMRAEVTAYVHSCVECQRVKHSQQKPAGLLLPLPIPSRPYDTITMDFVGPFPASGERKYDYLLTVIDKFSKRVHLLPCHKTIDAHQTARLLIDNVVRQFGLPASIISDRDPRWTGVLWTELFAAMGTKLKRSSSYHPQTDGQTERVHRVLEAMLRAYVNKKGSDWAEWLPTVEMSINSSVQEATGKTPFELTGVDWKDPLTLAMTSGGKVEMKSDAAREVLDGIKTAWEDARHMMMESQVKMKKYADLRRRDEQYAIGDQVMLSTKNLTRSKKVGKLSPLFVGPYEVVGVSAEGLNVTLDLPPIYQRIHQPFHISRVKRYTPSEIEWVGRDQVDRPLPDLVDGQQMWEVEAIKGKKLETRVQLVYDTRDIAEEEGKTEETADSKEEEKGDGVWGSRLRSRQGRPSVMPLSQPRKTRKVKAKKEAVTRTMYLVKWKGYEEQWWVDEDELQYCQEAIEEYERGQAVDQAARSEDSVALHCIHSWIVNEETPGSTVWSGALVL
jgi:transposase InsO family protein